jgi:hypothetical protein
MSASMPGVAAGRVRGQALRARNNTWVRSLMRVGLVSRGVVYGMLAYFAFDIARSGNSPEPASGQGALRAIARQPEGPALLAVLSVGLLGYAVWRAVQAVGGGEGERRTSVVKRVGFLASGAVYVALFVEALLLIAGSGGSGGSASSHPQPLVGQVLRWPGGPDLVGVAAAALIGGGIGLAIWSCVHDLGKTLETGRMSRRQFSAARATSIAGDVTRGVLVALIGAYLMAGAVTDNPSKVKSLGQVLKTIAAKSYGEWALVLAAIGLLSFAVFSVFEAIYRRL